MCSVLTGGRLATTSSSKSRNNPMEEMSEAESNPESPPKMSPRKTEEDNNQDREEELSVGSPERFEEEERSERKSETNSLRIFRSNQNKRGDLEKEDEDVEDESEGETDDDETEEDERPLDFTTTTTTTATTTGKRSLENNNATSGIKNPGGEEYFMPFKSLEMKSPTSHKIFKPLPVQLPPPPHLQQHGIRRLGPGHEDPEGGGPPSQKRRKGVQSFSIDEILSHKAASLAAKANGQQDHHNGVPQAIVRPWDISSAAAAISAMTGGGNSKNSSGVDRVSSTGSSNSSNNRRKSIEDSSPLDALFQMASKTFEGLKAKSELDPSQLSFTSKQPPKKKRKSRTAFTNHQIFELEKRFLYQKYLSPADRDEIAAQLGLTNAQVITWFQNRRAKLKRDMEELRKDVECTSQVIPHALGHQQQMAAAAVAALASRRLHNAAGLKFPMDLQHHRSPPPHHPHMFSPHAALMASMQQPGSNSSSRESLASPHSPMARSDRSDNRSPQIRVTDSDG